MSRHITKVEQKESNPRTPGSNRPPPTRDGELDASGAIDSLIDLIEDPACGSYLGVAERLPPQPELNRAKRELSRNLKVARISIDVGEDDILRGLEADLLIDLPADGGKGQRSLDVDFKLSLTGVNERQVIGAPENAEPLGRLFSQLDVNSFELLGVVQREGTLGVVEELLERVAADVSAAGGPQRRGGPGEADSLRLLRCLRGVASVADLNGCIGSG